MLMSGNLNEGHMDIHSCNILKDLKFFKMKRQENNKLKFFKEEIFRKILREHTIC